MSREEHPTLETTRPSNGPRENVEAEQLIEGLEDVLTLMAGRFRLDFREYKRGTLSRRTARRMALGQFPDWPSYVAFLREDPKELQALYDDLLIGVTGFFRDPGSWRHIEEEVVPGIIEGHPRDVPVRIWCAGCATGEEAYGLAMVFLEQLQKANHHSSLQVFASDVSQDALARARAGVYPFEIEKEVSTRRLDRYFEKTARGFEVKPILRQTVTFAAQNVLVDPPFARLDLVSCRNMLIYLEPEAQERIIEALSFSLVPGGILWLGSTETISSKDLFEILSAKHRTYKSVGAASGRRRRFARWVPDWSSAEGRRLPLNENTHEQRLSRQLQQLVLQRHTAPCVIINRNWEILYFFGPTDAYLRQPDGEARMDILSWLKPGLYGKLRTGLLEAVGEKKEVSVTGMRMERENGVVFIEAKIAPVPERTGGGLLLVSFLDAKEPLFAGMSLPNAEEGSLVEVLEQELVETRQELQGTLEQLDITTDDYRASHEELLSLNEELQSSNEELETSKEELQALNEELLSMNRQLEQRNNELRDLSDSLNNLLISARVPTLFLDRELRIKRFTPACTTILRVVEADVGRHVEDIRSLVDDQKMLEDARRVLDTLSILEAEVSSEDDRWFIRRILPYRTEDDRIDGVCVTFHDITSQKRAAAESEEARRYAEAIVHHSRMPLLVLDEGLRVLSANRAFLQIFRLEENEAVGRKLQDVGNSEWDIPELRGALETALIDKEGIRGFDVEHTFETVGWRSIRLNVGILERPSGLLVILSIEDVTDLRRAEDRERQRAEQLIREHHRKDEFLATLGHELRNPLSALCHGLELMEMTGTDPETGSVREKMSRQLDRMTAMLDQLLDVGRVISGKMSIEKGAVDVADAVEIATEALRPTIEAANQSLNVSLPDEGTVLVLGDAARLAQVVENLVSNATRYTDEGGQIWVTVSATEKTVKISVRDTGDGMDPELLGSAFELFMQGQRCSQRARAGLGLGLPLVRKLVEMHGGEAIATSPGPGKGSELIVNLPRLRGGLTSQKLKSKPGLSSVHRVLIVEDDEDAASFLAFFLRRLGQEVRVAKEGLAALDAARELQPELVLLDLGLPDLDGYQVVRLLREEHGGGMRIMAMTGYEMDLEKQRKAGIDAHLLKPVALKVLVGLLTDLEERT